MRGGKRGRDRGSGGGCVGGTGEDASSSSGSEWSSSETNVTRVAKDTTTKSLKESSNTPVARVDNSKFANKSVPLNEKGSMQSLADSLDLSLSNRQSSSLVQEFSNDVNSTRRYVNSKSLPKSDGDKDKVKDTKDVKKDTKTFHHDCKFANFPAKKTSK